MVVAGQIRSRSRSFRLRPGTASRRRAHGYEAGLVVLALVAGTMCFALAVAARQAAVAKVGYEIVDLRKELADLQAQSQRLEGQVARLQSLERVESEAKKLGMKKPDNTRLVYSEEPQKLPEADVMAAASGPTQWLLQAASALAKLASGIMRVQAQPIK